MAGCNLGLVAPGCCSFSFILGCSKCFNMIYFVARESTATAASGCLMLLALHSEWQTKCMLGSNLLLLVHILYLPHEFLKIFVGDQKQWWEFKPRHMDKALFFKMGKFYELLRMNKFISELHKLFEKMEILLEINYETRYKILTVLKWKEVVSLVLMEPPKAASVIQIVFSWNALC